MDKASREGVPSRPESARVAAAAVRLWDNAFLRLAPFIGDHGVLLLYRRSLHLSRSNHPLLAPLSEIAQTPVGEADFSGLKSALEREAPAEAEEASRALFSAFTGLLGTLIGEALTTRLLAPVPRDDETDESPQKISK